MSLPPNHPYASSITNVPMPTSKPKPVPKPRNKGAKVSGTIRNAARAYKQIYKSVYGVNPTLTYDGTWIRLQGQREGVSLKRLKEMTTQLHNRQG